MQAGKFEIPDSELKFTFARSGGPGGQNVNKVNSRAQLHWNVAATRALPDDVKTRFATQYKSRISDAGELLIDCDETRSQHENRQICLRRLAEMILAVASPPKKRIATKPTKASKQRRKQARKHRGAIKKLRRKVDWDE
ncbi:MAG: aminoacyl-tRNA hydrolase [Planctomycetes bacterium]|nr:aminoacyl-tRNA hydrolase [Planctomycetota bacterium]MCL4731373.1 aminoacyl-tRNA hydrolase [Planctomycetota bacterium]